MRFFHQCLAVLVIFVLGLVGSGAWAQKQPVGASRETEAADEKERQDATGVSPDTPVITIDGFCDPSSAIGTVDKKKCRTVVTRSEFEELAKAQNADSEAGKSRTAALYAKFALLAQEAQRQGMDKDPRIRMRLEMARIQVLGQALIQDEQAKIMKYTPEELEKFFRENPALFEQASIQRVFIPATKFTNVSPSVRQPIAESAPEMKALAESIHTRAVDGADFDALQKEALETSKMNDDSIVANLGKMTRSQLRKSQQVVFDLKPGQVSQLFAEPGEGFYIYKLGPREMPSFESAKSGAIPLYQKQRFDAWIDHITRTATMNEEYFGAAAAAAVNRSH